MVNRCDGIYTHSVYLYTDVQHSMNVCFFLAFVCRTTFEHLCVNIFDVKCYANIKIPRYIKVMGLFRLKFIGTCCAKCASTLSLSLPLIRSMAFDFIFVFHSLFSPISISTNIHYKYFNNVCYFFSLVCGIQKVYSCWQRLNTCTQKPGSNSPHLLCNWMWHRWKGTLKIFPFKSTKWTVNTIENGRTIVITHSASMR